MEAKPKLNSPRIGALLFAEEVNLEAAGGCSLTKLFEILYVHPIAKDIGKKYYFFVRLEGVYEKPKVTVTVLAPDGSVICSWDKTDYEPGRSMQFISPFLIPIVGYGEYVFRVSCGEITADAVLYVIKATSTPDGRRVGPQ